ncbi:hypothetical protein Tco_0831823 [Tanacetum coccineum]
MPPEKPSVFTPPRNSYYESFKRDKGPSGTCCGQPRIVQKSSSEEEEEMSDASKEKNQVGKVARCVVNANIAILRPTRDMRSEARSETKRCRSPKVNELSRPSSPEVKEVIRELVQCTAKRFFKEETISDLTKDSDVESQENHSNDDDGFYDTIRTS